MALSGVPLVKAGDDLCEITLRALERSRITLRNGDVLVLAQKIVSKAEGRRVDLAIVTPSPEALRLATLAGKDPRQVELLLSESTEVLRVRRGVIIVAHRLGFVMANAGIDLSNVNAEDADTHALLLPVDPDRSCARLRERLKVATGADVAVVINDSHGRAWRKGTVGVAIGASGLPALTDLRGRPDLFQRKLQTSEQGLADEIAAAASLLMGQAGEGTPIVLMRGVPHAAREGNAQELVRPKDEDLFRAPEPLPVFDAMTGAMRGRRSIRRYQSRPVDGQLLDKLLEAACLAPSAHNRQPWRFASLTSAADKTRLARAMGDRLRADRTRDGDAQEVIEADVARSFARLTQAPAIVLVCMTLGEMDRYPDERRREAERVMAVQSTAMAVQNLLLAAHAAGLGACWMCAPLFCPDAVRAALELPADWEPQALVTLGWPAGRGKPFSRVALEERVKRQEQKQ
jgi:coenzyme F420-0:L-glutamate ligase / coenzyme F420-1:gamma-L-glutamate ligase